MLMGGNSYASRARQTDNEHMKRLKQAFMQERMDQVSRSKKLHSETIKRRRALAMKKKAEAQKEEQRRQVILAKRKEQIREATEKYQRLNKHYDPRDYVNAVSSVPPRSAGPNLEEALRAIRGPSPKRMLQRSNSADRQRTSLTASTLRQNSAPSLRQGSSSSLRSNATSNYTYGTPASISTHEHQGQEYGNRNMDHIKTNIQSVSQLHNRSLSNLNASKSLFEQQLEHQQSLLQQQQQQYLQEFNRAVKEELNNPPSTSTSHGNSSAENKPQIQQQLSSDSLSSEDSLEIKTNEPVKSRVECKPTEEIMLFEQSVTTTTTFDPPPISSAPSTSPGSFHLNRPVNVTSPNVAVVQPNNASPQSSQATQLQKRPQQDAKITYPSCTATLQTDIITTTSTYGNMQQDSVVAQVTFKPAENQFKVPTPPVKDNPANTVPPRTQDILSISSVQPTASRAWATPSPSTAQSAVVSKTSASEIRPVIPCATMYDATERDNVIQATSQQQLSASTFTSAPSPPTKPSTAKMQPQTTKVIMSNNLYQVAPSSVNRNSRIPVAAHKSSNVLPPQRPPVSPVPYQDGDEEVEDSVTESESEVDETPEPEPRVIRGILKKRTGPIGSRTGGSVRLLVSGNNKGSIRDSLEVNRESIQRSARAKKSVRFAEKLCETQDECYSQVPFVIPSKKPEVKVKKETESPPAKPARPTSAQATSNTPKVDPSVKNPRVASAGIRRGPFLRPHPPAQPKSGRGATEHRNTNKAPSRYQSSNIVSAINAEPEPHPEEHGGITASLATPGVESQENNNSNNSILDPNSIHLDRTPTDDEINCLWDNVRSCLGKEGEQEDNAQEVHQPHNNANPRVQNRVGANYANNYMGSAYPPKKKVTIETLNNFNRKNSLLHGRRNGVNSNNVQPQPDQNTTQSTIHDLMHQQPKQSNAYPESTFAYGPDVSESMAAFLTAEMLAQRSTSESQIEAAMVEAEMRQHTLPQSKAPSALSIEEQRLMQSLERLNERLRIVEANKVNTPQAPVMPKPPSFGGFKGHAPFTNGKRQVNSNGTVSRYNYRHNGHNQSNHPNVNGFRIG